MRKKGIVFLILMALFMVSYGFCSLSISNVGITPNPYDPTDATMPIPKLVFSLNQSATLNITANNPNITNINNYQGHVGSNEVQLSVNSAITDGVYTITIASGTVTQTIAFVIDKTAPVISIQSVLPNPFSPNNDGINDFTKVNFKLDDSGNQFIKVGDLHVNNDGTINVTWVNQNFPASYLFVKRVGPAIATAQYDLTISGLGITETVGITTSNVIWKIGNSNSLFDRVMGVSSSSITPDDLELWAFQGNVSISAYTESGSLYQSYDFYNNYFGPTSGADHVVNDYNFQWSGNIPDGLYSLRISAVDGVGHVSTKSVSVYVNSFNIQLQDPVGGNTQFINPQKISPANQDFKYDFTTIAYKLKDNSNSDVKAKVTIKIYNSSEVFNETTLVKTIIDGVEQTGGIVYSYNWDGRNNNGQFLSQNAQTNYTCVISAVDARDPSDVVKIQKIITIDNLPPNPPYLNQPTITLTNNGSYTFSGGAEPGVLVKFYINNQYTGVSTVADPVSGSFSATVTFNQGTNVVLARTVDDVENVSGNSTAYSIIYDNTPPEVTILSPNDNTYVNGPVTISVNATDSYTTVTKVEFALSTSGPWSLGTSQGNNVWTYTLVPTQTTNTVYVRAFDQLNNQSAYKSVVIIYDSEAPTISNMDLLNGYSNHNIVKNGDNNVEISAIISDNNLARMTSDDVFADLSALTGNPAHNNVHPSSFSNGLAKWNLGALGLTINATEGTKQIKFRAVDDAGNNSINYFLSVIVDNTAPVISNIQNDLNVLYISNGTSPRVITADIYEVNGLAIANVSADLTTLSSSITSTTLQPNELNLINTGNYKARWANVVFSGLNNNIVPFAKVRAIDKAGNSSELVQNFIYDSGAPTIGSKVLVNEFGYNNIVTDSVTVVLKAQVSDDGEITINNIRADLSNIGGGTSVVPATWNVSTKIAEWSPIVTSGISNLVSIGVTPRITITATDRAGNTKSDSLNVIADIVVPTITNFNLNVSGYLWNNMENGVIATAKFDDNNEINRNNIRGNFASIGGSNNVLPHNFNAEERIATWYIPNVVLSGATPKISVSYRDNAGNFVSEEKTYIRDVFPPVVKYMQPADNSTVYNNLAKVYVNLVDNTVNYDPLGAGAGVNLLACNLKLKNISTNQYVQGIVTYDEAGSNLIFSASQPLPNSTNSYGDYQIEVFAKDNAGNSANYVYTFTLAQIPGLPQIVSLTHNRNENEVIGLGQIIKITATLNQNVPANMGRVFVDIGVNQRNIELFNDGLHGDGAANDNVYAVNYIVIPGSDISNGFLLGQFVNVVGQSSGYVQSNKRISIDATPPLLTNIFCNPSPFNPTFGPTTLSYTLGENIRTLNVEIFNANNVLVRSFTFAMNPDGSFSNTVQQGSNSFDWDGKDNNGNILPDGRYKIKFTPIDLAFNDASYITQNLITQARFSIDNLMISPAEITPNGDFVNDKVNISFDVSLNATDSQLIDLGFQPFRDNNSLDVPYALTSISVYNSNGELVSTLDHDGNPEIDSDNTYVKYMNPFSANSPEYPNRVGDKEKGNDWDNLIPFNPFYSFGTKYVAKDNTWLYPAGGVAPAGSYTVTVQAELTGKSINLTEQGYHATPNPRMFKLLTSIQQATFTAVVIPPNPNDVLPPHVTYFYMGTPTDTTQYAWGDSLNNANYYFNTPNLNRIIVSLEDLPNSIGSAGLDMNINKTKLTIIGPDGNVVPGYLETDAQSTLTYIFANPLRYIDADSNFVGDYDGEYTIKVKVYDKVGNIGEYQKRFFYDSTPPRVSQFIPSNNSYFNTPISEVSAKLIDSGIGPKLDESDITLFASFGEVNGSINYDFQTKTIKYTLDQPLVPGVDDGQYTIKVNAADSLGNLTSSPIASKFIFDTINPEVDSVWIQLRNGTIVHINNSGVTTVTDSIYRIYAHFKDNISGVDLSKSWIKLIGKAGQGQIPGLLVRDSNPIYLELQNPYPLENINSSYDIRVLTKDKAGNYQNPVYEILYKIVQDIEPPLAVTNLRATSVVGNKIRLDWTKSASPDCDKYKIYYDNGTGTINYTTPLYVTQNSNVTSWTTGTLIENVVYKFVVRAIDNNGNEEHNENYVEAKALSNPQAPVVTNIFVQPTVFSPNDDGVNDITTVTFLANATTPNAYLYCEVYSNNGELVRVLKNGQQITSGSNNTITWDGKNEYDAYVGNSKYTIKVYLKDENLLYSNPVLLNVYVDTVIPMISGMFLSSASITPDGDNYLDNVTITFDVTNSDSTDIAWLQVLSSDLALIKNVPFTPQFAGNGHYTGKWDGKDESGNYVTDGKYYIRAKVMDAAFNVNSRDMILNVDVNPPFVQITAPANNSEYTQSNYNIQVKGKAGDVSTINKIELQIVNALTGTAGPWINIPFTKKLEKLDKINSNSKKTAKDQFIFVDWSYNLNTSNLPGPGVYKIRVRATDIYGHYNLSNSFYPIAEVIIRYDNTTPPILLSWNAIPGKVVKDSTLLTIETVWDKANYDNFKVSFSNIDSEFDSAKVSYNIQDNKYSATYRISPNNTQPDGIYTIPVSIRGIITTQIDTIRIQLDNTKPIWNGYAYLNNSEGIFVNGDTVRLITRWDSGNYTVTADFSRVDSEALLPVEAIYDNVNNYYYIERVISKGNTIQPGNYKVLVKAVDKAGNICVKEIDITLRKAGPAIHSTFINHASNGYRFKNGDTFELTVLFYEDLGPTGSIYLDLSKLDNKFTADSLKIYGPTETSQGLFEYKIKYTISTENTLTDGAKKIIFKASNGIAETLPMEFTVYLDNNVINPSETNMVLTPVEKIGDFYYSNRDSVNIYFENLSSEIKKLRIINTDTGMLINEVLVNNDNTVNARIKLNEGRNSITLYFIDDLGNISPNGLSLLIYVVTKEQVLILSPINEHKDDAFVIKSLKSIKKVDVSIYNTAGLWVKDLKKELVDPSKIVKFGWDCLNKNGEKVLNGPYIFKVKITYSDGSSSSYNRAGVILK